MMSKMVLLHFLHVGRKIRVMQAIVKRMVGIKNTQGTGDAYA